MFEAEINGMFCPTYDTLTEKQKKYSLLVPYAGTAAQPLSVIIYISATHDIL